MLQLLGVILGIVSQILGLAQTIQALVSKTAQETAPLAIETIAANGTNTVINPTYGNAALHTDLATLAASHTLQDILDAIAALPISDPVNLPPVPPPGYGGGDPGDIASAVWQALDPNSFNGNTPYGDEQMHPDAFARAAGDNLAFRAQLAPWFLLDDIEWWDIYQIPSRDWPEVDFDDIQAGDTIGTWLNRTSPNWTWAWDANRGFWTGYRTATGQGNGPTFVLTMTPDQFAGLKGQAAASIAPPVWPGVANVTLGTPVALVDQLVITEPMDGVIIAVTTPPSKVGVRVIGGAYYDYSAGEIAFESDNGELEPWQYLGFRAAVFCPKSMVQAAAVHLRVLGGAEGTVTPWVIAS